MGNGRNLRYAPIAAAIAMVVLSMLAWTVTASSAGENDACNIKGNVNTRAERIYHVPGQRYYDKTKIVAAHGERWFCSEAEARKAGWRKSKV